MFPGKEARRMNDAIRLRLRTAIRIIVVALTVTGALIACGLLPPAANTVWNDGYGDRYEGVTRGGDLTGDFEISYKDGSSYTGTLKDGQFNGKGEYTSVDGWTFEGHFIKGIADGEGKITDPGLGTYSGLFKNGEAAGTV
jgi:hypothetical protein